jgi:hypothetical protein
MKRTMIISGLTAALTLTAGVADAQERTHAYWARPVQADLAGKLYPGFAALIGQSGKVTLLCPVDGDGPVYLCEVVDETPRGLGFGAAARVMAASAEVGASRRDGVVVPSRIRFRTHFSMADQGRPYGGWTGPEPGPATLALAREMVEDVAEARWLPPSYRDQMLDGLDYDRRAVVGPWLDELFPRDEAREKATMALQLARLFDATELRRIRAGEPVDWPSEEEFFAACPDPTPAELAAMEVLRRRYCERYECGVEPAS